LQRIFTTGSDYARRFAQTAHDRQRGILPTVCTLAIVPIQPETRIVIYFLVLKDKVIFTDNAKAAADWVYFDGAVLIERDAIIAATLLSYLSQK